MPVVPSPTIALPKLQCAKCRSINKIPNPDDVCSFSQNAFLPGSSGPFAKLPKAPSQNVSVREKGMVKCRFEIEVASVEPACVLSNSANRRECCASWPGSAPSGLWNLDSFRGAAGAEAVSAASRLWANLGASDFVRPLVALAAVPGPDLNHPGRHGQGECLVEVGRGDREQKSLLEVLWHKVPSDDFEDVGDELQRGLGVLDVRSPKPRG